MAYDTICDIGRRRRFILRILGDRGSYPDVQFETPEVIFSSGQTLTYTIVLAEDPENEAVSEIAWAHSAEIRLWGAVAFAIQEGQGFYCFHPLEPVNVFAAELDAKRIRRLATRVSCSNPPQRHHLHWIRPSPCDIQRLYTALERAEVPLLRGVGCYLKSLMLFRQPLLVEEMGMNLHLALEAGLGTLRKRLSIQAGRSISYRDTFKFVEDNFEYGSALAAFWQERRDDRNLLFHPDCDLGSYVMPPLDVDDVYELMDPMLSLYRYLLIGAKRPQ